MFNQGRNIRWVIILLSTIALFLALIVKLYDLTITRGDEYKTIAETKRMKEIEISAPRGNIFDRNGKLLAGSRTSFAVQAYKDDLMALSAEERNAFLERLIEYFEWDGVEYFDSYPIGVNAFVYPNDDDYFQNRDHPVKVVQDALKQHDLIGEWLTLVYEDPKHPEFSVSVAKRALTSMSLKGSKLPIEADRKGNLSFVEGEEYEEYAANNDIEGKSALEVLTAQVASNDNIIDQILGHAAVHKVTYDLLKEKNLLKGVELADYVFTYEENFRTVKGSLHKYFSSITLNSTPKDDFIAIVKKDALDGFLTGLSVEENNRFVIPAEKIINLLSEQGVDSNLSYEISDDATKVKIVFENKEETLELPIDRLKKLAKKYDLLDRVIADEECKYIAEQAMFNQGIYPGININSWKYGNTINQEDFIEANALEGMSATQAFVQLKEKHDIAEGNNPIVDLAIMVITDRVRAQGNYAYAPVNLCYELSAPTVAHIEENIPTYSGLAVSREPIRYYPYGESASHILGYIGKIATDQEVQKYVKEKGYRPNELVGKTGVEESFEDTLHGVNGKEIVLIDSYGNRTDTVERVEPKPGNNLYLTIDIELQQVAERALKNDILAIKHGMPFHSPWGNINVGYSPAINDGATVAVDPDSGALLAMASYPGYDPNLFVTGISGSDWKSLLTEEDKNSDEPRPLMNLATQTAVQPGSTFKVVSALTGLDKGLGENDTITCSGYIDIGDTRFACLVWTLSRGAHGPVNVKQALGVSCNYFFYSLGLGEDPKGNPHPGVQTTVDDINAMAKRLGLDKRSGLEINYPLETRDAIPSREGKLDLAQGMIRNFLRSELVKYKKEGVFKNAEDLAEDIETIVAWAEKGPGNVRQEVIDGLEELGYYGEKPLENSYTGLGDILKYTYFNQAAWTTSDSMNIMIGQGQVGITPISATKLTSIIANGGTDYKLTLVDKIQNYEDEQVIFRQEAQGRKTDIDPDHFRIVRDGMLLSARDSKKYFSGLPFEVGSKTGTAERDGISPTTGAKYPEYSWNLSFAPFDDPKIVSVTFLPSAGYGMYSIPVSRDVIAAYMDVEPSETYNPDYYGSLKTYYPKEDSEEEKKAEE